MKALGTAPSAATDAATKAYVDTTKTALRQITAASYTAVANDLVRADATSVNITITVPNTLGASVTVVRVDASAHTVTVTASSGTVAGDASASLVGVGAAAVFIGDGTNVQIASIYGQTAPSYPINVVLLEAAGVYPPRPSTTVTPAGYAEYRGIDQPTDWVDGDVWDALPP